MAKEIQHFFHIAKETAEMCPKTFPGSVSAHIERFHKSEIRLQEKIL